MPSTNVNVGLMEGRSSSRVLKPPGGGHSDIFGRFATTPQNPYVPHKSPAHLSGIQACLYNSDSNDSANGKDANGATVTVTTDAGVSGCNIEDANGKLQQVAGIAGEETEAKEVAPAPVATTVPAPPKVLVPPKVRVPPGGFSSGFW